ncbi:MAG: hypothetical protein D3917_20265, partial [Candidatus Electrothrix sp. AX5]|nr:hypothetical protein [Candidatus Electrothrix sp. AX5]
LECIAKRTRPRTDGEEGLRVLTVLNCCQESLEKGKASLVQVAFARKVNGKMEIYVVQANGDEMRPLFALEGNQSYPRWSPRLH